MTSRPAAPLSKLTQHEARWRTYLQGIREGRSESLGQLYDETCALLMGLAVRVLRDPADAEEVVLDVYQQVWRSAGTFDPTRGSVMGWLTMVTRSRAIDRLRSAGARRTRETPIEDKLDLPSDAPPPESQSIFAQEQQLVRRALEELDPDQREAIELAFFRGLTHVEVAEALGAPLGTIKTRIRSGMRKLREALEPAPAGGNENN